MNMKNKFFALLLVMLFCMTLCSCSQKQSTVTETESKNPLENIAEGGEPEPKQTFPFEDDEGRMRYRLVINGREVETKNLPFTYPDAPKGGYYPLKDVLAYFGVECLCSKDESVLTTKINGSILKVTAGKPEMTYGRKSIKLVSALDAPVCIDGCLYVPSVLFMSVFDDGIVDFSGDRSAATLETNVVIDLAASGTAGLSVPSGGAASEVSGGKGSSGSTSGANCGTCNGAGRSICTYCSGTGSKIEYQQIYDPVSKQYKQTQKTVFCPRCGGSGRVTCPMCGGSGKR